MTKYITASVALVIALANLAGVAAGGHLSWFSQLLWTIIAALWIIAAMLYMWISDLRKRQP